MGGTYPIFALGILFLLSFEISNALQVPAIGVIPKERGNLYALQELHLGHNELTGQLPFSFNKTYKFAAHEPRPRRGRDKGFCGNLVTATDPLLDISLTCQLVVTKVQVEQFTECPHLPGDVTCVDIGGVISAPTISVEYVSRLSVRGSGVNRKMPKIYTHRSS